MLSKTHSYVLHIVNIPTMWCFQIMGKPTR